jgi:hypothetical protein
MFANGVKIREALSGESKSQTYVQNHFVETADRRAFGLGDS